jgi:hypothetical protein
MKNVGLTLVVGSLLLAPALSAQEDPMFVFGQYFRCNQAIEAQADEVVQEVFAPVIQRHVDAGHLTGWLWLTHDQGGAWRRLLATSGSDMNQMMEVRAQIVAEVSQNEEAMARLGAACGGHDDYVWVATTTSTANPEVMGSASVSSYHMCDRSREGRADEIFADVLAPLYQKHVDMGHLASYGFYSHRIGGVFRRLETVSGPDHATVLEMQSAVYNEAAQTNPFAIQEYTQICSTHSDYLWSNETPGS